jgi:hypothetical protein
MLELITEARWGNRNWWMRQVQWTKTRWLTGEWDRSSEQRPADWLVNETGPVNEYPLTDWWMRQVQWTKTCWLTGEWDRSSEQRPADWLVNETDPVNEYPLTDWWMRQVQWTKTCWLTGEWDRSSERILADWLVNETGPVNRLTGERDRSREPRLIKVNNGSLEQRPGSSRSHRWFVLLDPFVPERYVTYWYFSGTFYTNVNSRFFGSFRLLNDSLITTQAI